MPPRRRTPSTPGLVRKPRVAGLAPAAGRAGEATRAPSAGPSGEVAAVPVSPVPDSPATNGAATDGPAPDGPATAGESAHLGQVAVLTRPDARPEAVPERAKRPLAGFRARPAHVLGVALAVLVTLAAGLGIGDHLLRNTPAARNVALADVGATTDVLGQVSSALETVYSYDFTQLDKNERLAREVITPAFAEKFGQLFAQVRQLAPQQQAVVSATVTMAAVQSIEGDRAVVVAFIDQEATRANAGAQPQQLSAAGRLTVTAERDGDRWRIADVVNR